jgi:hypothetical protein
VTRAARRGIIASVVPAYAVARLSCALIVAACGNPSSTTDARVGGDVPLDVPVHVDDGTPTRISCVSSFGNELTNNFGRLDGFLVAIVPVSASGCNGDSDHVHLQVKMEGEIYDVAVNVGTKGGSDVGTTTRDIWLPTTWQEGWHTGVGINYVSMGVHSTDLPPRPSTQNASELTASLANVNHISIFATGYGPEGVHLVHRNFGGRDGLIITDPLSAPVRARMFAFSNEPF